MSVQTLEEIFEDTNTTVVKELPPTEITADKLIGELDLYEIESESESDEKTSEKPKESGKTPKRVTPENVPITPENVPITPESGEKEKTE